MCIENGILIIFPVILQTVINLIMLSIEEQGVLLEWADHTGCHWLASHPRAKIF